MGVLGVVTVGGLGFGAYWAYKKGLLADLLGGAGADAGGDAGGSGGTPFGPWLPASSPVVGKNSYEQILRDNWAYVSPWARANYQWVCAMIKQESGTQGSKARGSAGEIGLMQVKPATAAEMVTRGYGELSATESVMATDRGGVYFGCAYLQYLSGKKSDRAWITKAYNGGPGWESLSSSYKAAREIYYSEVLKKYNEMWGVSV